MSARYSVWITVIYLSIFLLKKMLFHKISANSAHNWNNYTSYFLWDKHYNLACSIVSLSSQWRLKRTVLKNWDLIILTIFTTWLKTFLSEIGIFL